MRRITHAAPSIRHLAWFLGLLLAVPLSSSAARRPRTFLLSSGQRVGTVTRVEATLEVGGHVQPDQGDNSQAVPISVVAHLKYEEQLLGNASPLPCLGWRHYEQAQATIKMDQGGLQRKLDDGLRQIVVECRSDGTTMHCPAGPLTRNELDLIDVVGNSLLLDRLLPGDRKAVGDTWQPDEEVLQALLLLDRIRNTDVEAKLYQVKSRTADIRLTGTVQGSTVGADTELSLMARLAYDIKLRRLTGVTLAIREQRQAGPIGPGVDVTAKLRLKRRWMRKARYLTKKEQPSATSESLASQSKLHFQAETNSFRLLCDPNWYVTSESPQSTVLRLIDRGDLLAQCNISPVTPRSTEGAISLSQYRQSVAHTLADFEARIVEEGERVDERNQLVYRIVAEGVVKEVPVTWRYYLIANPDGQRVALAFTIEAALAARFEDADQRLVATMELFTPSTGKAETADRTSTETR